MYSLFILDSKKNRCGNCLPFRRRVLPYVDFLHKQMSQFVMFKSPLNGQAALTQIERFLESNNGKLSPEEQEALKIASMDAAQAYALQRDNQAFYEFERVKLAELEYLYQARGIRQALPSAVFGEGYSGYGNGWTGSKIRLLYPQDRKRANRESKEPFIPINKIIETVRSTQDLVPLRLNLGTDKYRLKDRILWDAEDATIPLELFVENLLEDFGIPLSLAPQAFKQLHEQINSHLPHIYPKTGDSNEQLGSDDYDEDMRIVIKLDITIGHHQLKDQFEWDINNVENDPELFGVGLANDLDLPMEFGPAIAFAIREQLQLFTKQLFNVGYQFNGAPVTDPSLIGDLSLPVNEHTFLRRPELLDSFSPKLIEAKISGYNDFHDQETERRELRSRRRQGRSSRRHVADQQVNNSASEVTFFPQEIKGPDYCTPAYSGTLPGGLERNLDILHMSLYHADEGYGGDRSDLVYNFQKARKNTNEPSVSLYEYEPEKPKWIVKMKMPRFTPN